MRFLATLAVGVLVLAAAAVGAPADAFAATATAKKAATTATPSEVSVAPSDFGDLAGGRPLRLFLTLTDATGDGILAGTVTVSVGRAAVTSRSALEKWFDGTGRSSSATTVLSTDTPTLLSGETRVVSLTVPAAKLHFSGTGVHEVSVSVDVAGAVIGSSRTAVAYKPSTSKAVPVALAAPLTVPTGSSTFIDSKTLATDTAANGILTKELNDIADTPVAIGIDPRIIASIRVLGKTAPTTALDWLDQLQSVSNETFPLQWADADVTAALQAGSSTVPAPRSLEYAISANLFNATSTPAATPTPSPTDSANDFPLPTSASLVQWDYTLPKLAWPAENSVIATDVPKIERSGITSTILASGNVTIPSSHAGAGASASDGNLAIGISDATLSGYLRAATAATTREAWTSAVAKLTTTLDLISAESSATSPVVLATLDRGWSGSDTRLADTITALYSRSWVSSSALSDVFSATPVAVRIKNSPQAETRLDDVRRLLLAERRVARYSIVADPNQLALTSPQRLSLLSVLSDEWLADPVGWSSAVTAYLSRSHKTIRSVEIADSSSVLLPANEASLPIVIGNTLAVPVTVYVALVPKTTLLSVNPGYGRVKVSIDANAQRRIVIPVQAISNGKVQATVSLYSSSGQRIGSVKTLDITVHAGWETIGTAIFGGLIVLVFAVGIVRNIRRFRRSRAQRGKEA